MVHYRVHISPPLVLILSQMNPVHTSHLLSLRPIVILSTHLRLGVSSDLFPSDLRTKILYAFLISPMRSTCPAHLILNSITGPLLRHELCGWLRSLCRVTVSFRSRWLSHTRLGTGESLLSVYPID